MARVNVCLVGVAVVLLYPLFSPGVSRSEADDAVEKELKALCGEWKYSKGPAGAAVTGKLILRKDGTYSYSDDALGLDGEQGMFTIDPTPQPRTLDLVNKDGKTFLFICELKGKELTLGVYLGDDAAKRPGSFKDKGVVVEKFK
jgi:uncharacterized protein (TIGR03067 family)